MEWRLGVAGFAWVAAWGGVLLAAAAARAGNTYTFLVGGRAAGMGGAYAAMSEEASVAWHNPAGLGFNDRSSLDVSASAFFVQFVRVPDLLVTHMPSGDVSSDFDTTAFQVVPTSLSYVYKVGRPDPAAPVEAGTPRPRMSHSIALSVFVPESMKFSKSVTTDLSDITDEGLPFDYHHRISVDMVRTRYYIGPSWGMSIGDEWAVGASLFVTYGTETGRASFNVDVLANDPASPRHFFSVLEENASSTEFGAAFVAGVQWRPVSGLRVGLTTRLPGLRFFRSRSGSSLEAGATDEGREFADVEPDDSPWGTGMSSPFGVTLGLGWAQKDSFAIAIEGDYTAPHEDTASGIDRKGFFNGRVGAEVRLSPGWLLSLGAYTDLSPEGGARDFMSTRVHFFGGTAAVTVLAPYRVVGSDRTEVITFSNTFGIKYAYGFGDAGGFEFWPVAAAGEETVRPLTRSVSMHEFSVIVGSSVLF